MVTIKRKLFKAKSPEDLCLS